MQLLPSCWLLLVVLVVFVQGDVYMHAPRGSNNRINEATAQRGSNNRLFDSQNNNRGGYNVGDKLDTAATTGVLSSTDPATLYDPADTTAFQYPMMYFEGSVLPVEWTNQHGCGGNVDDPRGGNCNIVLQMTCDTDPTKVTDKALQVTLRDGTSTTQANENNGNDNTVGYHESATYNTECNTRTRNKGLFAADQNLNGNSARTTRQNPGGGASGNECPEERDYYPYWGPTPWIDVAYLTDRVDLCPYILAQTQNSNLKYKCVNANTNQASTRAQLDSTTESTCNNNGGTFIAVRHDVKNPVCEQVAWSRENHLGNGRTNQPLTWNWTLPFISELPNVATYGSSNYARCVLRLRYNISTDDYDPWNTTSAQNGKVVIAQDPTVDIGADLQGIRLSLNTHQTGRTFQDRSHVFYIKKRPATGLLASPTPILNLNVRGKRGNIVQVYPAVEYDFVPNRLHVPKNALVHLQWTGSNTHNNSGDGGDGQAGDDGEGRTGTDRSNIVALGAMDQNFPLPLDKSDPNGRARPFNLMQSIECYKPNGDAIGTVDSATGVNVDCAVWLATSGYFRSAASVTGAANGNDGVDPELNNAPASLVGGVIIKPTRVGSFNYVSTRNNNFSNRSQKGTLIFNAT